MLGSCPLTHKGSMKPTQPEVPDNALTSVVVLSKWRQEVSLALDRLELRVGSLERRVGLYALGGAALPAVVELVARWLF